MNIFTFALRNMLRNKRRSVITLLAVAIGFTAINIFGGYTHNSFQSLEKSAIYGEGKGHLTIMKKDFLVQGRIDPAQYMITNEAQEKIRQLLRQNPHIKNIAPRMRVSGLISNGVTSTIFVADAVNPDDYALFTQQFPYRGTGSAITSSRALGCQMGSTLAEILNFQLNSMGTLLTNTLDGQMNAQDMEVAGIYNAGYDDINDKYLFMPLSLAQSLLNTSSVDQMVLLLDTTENTESVRTWLAQALPTIGFDADIKSWDELSAFYQKVRSLYKVIFLFIFCIVLGIVVTDIVNTMTMSVVERTREIGTLRSLGLRKKEVLEIFTAEGFVLGICGIAVGIVFTVITSYGIALLHITYIPPGISERVPLLSDIVPFNMLWSGMFLVFLSMCAAFIPSTKASRMNIVDALGHI